MIGSAYASRKPAASSAEPSNAIAMRLPRLRAADTNSSTAVATACDGPPPIRNNVMDPAYPRGVLAPRTASMIPGIAASIAARVSMKSSTVPYHGSAMPLPLAAAGSKSVTRLR